MKKPWSVWLLAGLLVIFSIGGFYGGMSMLLDPSGKALGVDIVLHQLPVRNFLLPGLFLLAVMGLFPLFLAYSLLARPEWQWMEAVLGWAPYHWGVDRNTPAGSGVGHLAAG
ncbi:MAG: hypothetical protein JXA25_11725 [Anaerolineales bacterium]|nr:hypothetical protein [Anaerolineales bacterium]